MHVGIQLPQWGTTASRGQLIRLATDAEAAGFDSVWASDHVVYPLDGPATYPYSSSGEPPFGPDDGYLEALTTLAVIAGATDHIRLGTSVLILPMRPFLLTAKSLSTLDQLSGGRLVIAVSAGWWKAEFDALGADFERRGGVLDAQLAALQEIWSRGRGSASGPYLTFPDVAVEPRPKQEGGPEVWVGGHGSRVWARIARSIAVGWHGIGHDVDKIAAARAGIQLACGESGRDVSSIRFSTATGLPPSGDRILDRVEKLRSAGVDQIVFIPRLDSGDALLRAVEVFGSEVRPRL